MACLFRTMNCAIPFSAFRNKTRLQQSCLTHGYGMFAVCVALFVMRFLHGCQYMYKNGQVTSARNFVPLNRERANEAFDSLLVVLRFPREKTCMIFFVQKL